MDDSVSRSAALGFTLANIPLVPGAEALLGHLLVGDDERQQGPQRVGHLRCDTRHSERRVGTGGTVIMVAAVRST
ncbi:hypothetical protein ACIQ6K_40295 [Streptomyces sp. NPDC096354]|uniref:hypothetical protein n=1 Tax=Streptomyces sp. NPDC096354 TaxID=3366088 RepID=UPI0038302117